MKKRKKLADVYMREVIDSDIRIIKDEELNAYITYKHINKTSHTCRIYINGRKVPIVGENYTLLEYSPCDELYNVRIFIDDKANILMYYFDVVLSFDNIGNEIYYDDLYLDVIYDVPFSTKTTHFITLVDENELLDALNNKDITQEQYDMAYDVANKIMNELLNKKNRFVNRGIKDYLRFIDN